MKGYRPALLVSAVIILAVATSCRRQSPNTPVPILMRGALEYGQTAEGTLADLETRWVFDGQQGDVVLLTFEGVFEDAPGADLPLLVVTGTGSEALARLMPGSGHSVEFRLPETRQFTIALRAGQGRYTLGLHRVRDGDGPTVTPPPTPTADPAGQPIRIGERVQGSLPTSDALDLWSFEATAGAVVTLHMESLSKDLVPVLRLFSPDGELLAGDDNGAAARSATLPSVWLPETGTYLVQTWGGGWPGDYTLLLMRGSPPPTPTTTLAPTRAAPGPTATPTITPTYIAVAHSGAILQLGEPVRGVIREADQRDRFAVFGPAGAVISIGMFAVEGGALVPAFEVFAPNGEQIAAVSGDPASDRPGEALLNGFVLPVTGAYIIFAGAAPGAPPGPYTLAAGEGWALREIRGGMARVGMTYRGELLRSGDRETWIYDLPTSATISVEVVPETASFNPVIEIVGPDGAQLAAVRGGPGGTAHVPEVTTAMGGRYLVRVTAFRNESVGGYLVTTRLEHVTPTATFAPVDATLPVVVRQGERHTFTFEAVPGDLLLVEARAVDPAWFDPVIELYGPSGRRIARADDISGSNTDAALQTALDDGIGQYRVEVFGYALMPGSFTLRVRTG